MRRNFRDFLSYRSWGGVRREWWGLCPDRPLRPRLGFEFSPCQLGCRRARRGWSNGCRRRHYLELRWRLQRAGRQRRGRGRCFCNRSSIGDRRGGASTGNRRCVQYAAEYRMSAFSNRRRCGSHGACALILGACLALWRKDGTRIGDGRRIRKQARHCWRRLRHIRDGSSRCGRTKGVCQFRGAPTGCCGHLQLMRGWLCVLRLRLRLLAV
jgi:hypothetical protein